MQNSLSTIDTKTEAKLYAIHADVVNKLDQIRNIYVDYPSCQHAAWIIQEEYLEVRDELLKKDANWDYTKIYKELIDLITACYRTIIDRDLQAQVQASIENTEDY